MEYQGSCHCGRIAFEVSGEISKLMSCNCSICSRKGALMWFAPRDSLRLSTPEADMSTYTFNKHVIQHYFCPTCGIHAFGEAMDASGRRMAAVNARCLSGLDLTSIPVESYDGRAR